MTGDVLRIAAVLIIIAVFILLIKSHRAEIGILITVGAATVILLLVFGEVVPAISRLKTLFEKSGVDAEYFTVVLKSLGIAYITGFAADTCRDFGFSSLAAKAEFAGRCAILIISLPLLTEILNTALEFAGV